MRVRGIARLRLLARRYTNRSYPGPIVLAYHRVADLPSDPQLLSVTPRHFAEQVEVLRKQGHPMRLQDMTLALRDRTALPDGVVVTFDDGYADNLIHAKPVLERYDVPATVFVTTGYVGKERDFWWDELEKLLLQRDALPLMLRLNISGKVHEWNLSFPSNSHEICEHSWTVAEDNDPGPRQTTYRALHQLLRPLMEDERRRVLSALREWAGAGAVPLGHRAPLSPAEVIELARGDLVEVGSHSVTHPVFSSLSATAQRMEIERSKSDLEDILGRTVRSFAYPYGAKSDYTEETTAAVQQAGYLCACSNFPGIVDAATDRFQLPRFLVRDWDGDEFSRRLAGWLGG
jgi:peptidoglycan/xylan/chitin deacetylase (PgdA/CDA1 family)